MTSTFSRRTLARTLAGASAALALPDLSRAQPAPMPPIPAPSPKASSGAQPPPPTRLKAPYLEADGRGAIHLGHLLPHPRQDLHDGDTGDVADDYYHRYKAGHRPDEGSLGLKSCRFSVAWSRIFPLGTGAPNPMGLDFYHRMIDALLEAGIAALLHPLPLGSCPSPSRTTAAGKTETPPRPSPTTPDTPPASSPTRSSHFMTMNEMRTFVELGYGDGTHAPGLKVGPKRLAQLNHYVPSSATASRSRPSAPIPAPAPKSASPTT